MGGVGVSSTPLPFFGWPARRARPPGRGIALRAPGRLAPRYGGAVFFLLLGCPAPLADSGVASPASVLPAFTEVSVVCDASVPAWAFDLHTDAWTGGGELWMSVDGVYVEAHPFTSAEAALDGSFDHLRFTLAITSDFRDVAAGSRTSFNCGTPALQGLLVVYARDGDTVADCRVYGGDASVWPRWGFPSCADEAEVKPTAD